MSTASASMDWWIEPSTAATNFHPDWIFWSASPSSEGIPLEVFRNLKIEKPIMTKQTEKKESKWLRKVIKNRGLR